jgi:hypothetical protein
MGAGSGADQRTPRGDGPSTSRASRRSSTRYLYRRRGAARCEPKLTRRRDDQAARAQRWSRCPTGSGPPPPGAKVIGPPSRHPEATCTDARGLPATLPIGEVRPEYHARSCRGIQRDDRVVEPVEAALPLADDGGSKVPLPSPETVISTEPTSVSTALVVRPWREFPEPAPAGSPRS